MAQNPKKARTNTRNTKPIFKYPENQTSKTSAFSVPDFNWLLIPRHAFRAWYKSSGLGCACETRSTVICFLKLAALALRCLRIEIETGGAIHVRA